MTTPAGGATRRPRFAKDLLRREPEATMTRMERIDRADEPALENLPRDRLEAMATAGAEVLECTRVLKKGGLNVVKEVLRGAPKFIKLDHYPKGDVYDRESHSQFYYHAHRGDHEHGHFHTFLRAGGMPAGLQPAPEAVGPKRPEGDKALAHLVAISMDAHARPVGLFTTNRWVTGESWYGASDVIAMLDRFVIDHAWPSWPTNRWITAMMRLFRPTVEALLHERDARLAAWAARHPDRHVYEDRALETISDAAISVEAQIAAVEAALGR